MPEPLWRRSSESEGGLARRSSESEGGGFDHAPAGSMPSPLAADVHPLLSGYGVPGRHFDELLAPTGAPRAHWADFLRLAGDLGPAWLSRADARVARQIHENGVTYNVYAAPRGASRPWALDVLPHLVPAAEWDAVGVGLRQRARLLNRMAADLYGDQRLLANGIVPPALVFGHPGFLRACQGVRPRADIYLHVVAFDLARGPDGLWRVIGTRSQAPSGAGYALENRVTVSRLFPDAFRDLHVRRLAPFFRTLQETLLEAAPRGGDTPHIVLLTPGPYSETCFEHAYLARYLGFTLAEGGDLTVRDNRVFLKTVTGLQPVHAILRRLDDDFCDPLELRADSTLGVAGLVQAWRAGQVLVANAFGMSVLESPGLLGYLPAVCEFLLGEQLQLLSPTTNWCGDREALTAALPRLTDMVIKPTFPDLRLEPVFVEGLDAAERSSWIARLQSTPEHYALEEYLPLSHVPVWHEGRLESRALMLRAFLVSDGHGDYRVMQGGLSRIAGSDRQVVSGQRGGSSKDTWVLSDVPVERFSLLRGTLRTEDIMRSERMVSSRAGENLFWLGRYAERSENGARLMRAVLSRLHADALLSGWAHPVIETCRRYGLLGARQAKEPSPHDFELALLEGLVDAKTLHSLAFNIEQTVNAASAVRDRLSSDNWRALNQLSQVFVRQTSRPASVAEALELIDQTIMSLVAIGGLEMGHMTRDDGWRFLSLGRHLERLLFIATTVAEVAASDTADEPSLLEWLLDLSDSIITYRARYMHQPEWLAVADLLLFDRRNPRSAAFQLARLSKHVQLLPSADLTELVATLDRLSASHTAHPAQGDLFPRSSSLTEFLQSCEQLARRLSDELTLRYFSHVYESAHATAVI